MTLVVLVILAALWAIVLLPPLLRSRSGRSNDSIGEFNYRLDALGRTNGAVQLSTQMRSVRGRRAAKRRRDVVSVLLVALGLSGLTAIATNAMIVWMLFVLVALALGAFFALWAYARSLQADRIAKVRSMPAARAPEYRLRRAASS